MEPVSTMVPATAKIMQKKEEEIHYGLKEMAKSSN